MWPFEVRWFESIPFHQIPKTHLDNVYWINGVTIQALKRDLVCTGDRATTVAAARLKKFNASASLRENKFPARATHSPPFRTRSMTGNRHRYHLQKERITGDGHALIIHQ